jgi:ABC transporter substrate binding protein
MASKHRTSSLITCERKRRREHRHVFTVLKRCTLCRKRPARSALSLPHWKSGEQRISLPRLSRSRAAWMTLVNTHRIHINSLALAARLPSMHGFREFVEAGGLMSYGANFPDLFRRAADLVDKILRGVKPGEIPVEQPTRFDLVINLKTAKALGLEIPDKLLALANEVIE